MKSSHKLNEKSVKNIRIGFTHHKHTAFHWNPDYFRAETPAVDSAFLPDFVYLSLFVEVFHVTSESFLLQCCWLHLMQRMFMVGALSEK